MASLIQVNTDHPVAFDSPDHLYPWGTARDNSTNRLFNEKIYTLFSFLPERLKVLDLGCSGGGFVKECIDDGCLAVGLEGSDYSKRHCRAEWPALGNRFLFTSDITREFTILMGEEPLTFDLITSWEVLEHLPEERLDLFCKNVHHHLAPHGLVVVSVSPNEEVINSHRLHLTVKDHDWWVEMFRANGLHHLPQYHAYFNSQFIRGPKQNAPGSFHLFLSKDPNKAPVPPRLNSKQRMTDKWLGSKLHKKLHRLLGD